MSEKGVPPPPAGLYHGGSLCTRWWKVGDRRFAVRFSGTDGAPNADSDFIPFPGND